MSDRVSIMIIDDEPIVGKRLKRLLQKDGYEVETFTRGSVAVEELERKSFDIILTDLKMGRVDGIQVLEIAKRKNPDTKVIIISGLAKVELVVEAFKKGAFGFVIKPFKIEELKKTIKEALIQLKPKD